MQQHFPTRFSWGRGDCFPSCQQQVMIPQKLAVFGSLAGCIGVFSGVVCRCFGMIPGMRYRQRDGLYGLAPKARTMSLWVLQSMAGKQGSCKILGCPSSSSLPSCLGAGQQRRKDYKRPHSAVDKHFSFHSRSRSIANSARKDYAAMIF